MTIGIYLDELVEDIEKIRKQKKDIKKVSRILRNSKTIYICGNGGSSAAASHMVNDLQKMCGLRAVCLTDNTPILTAWANDTDYSLVFVNQLKTMARKGDVLVIISGSGESGNLMRAAHWALENQMKVICIIGNKNAKMLDFEGINSIVVDTDMQHAEDCHVIIGHILAKTMMK